MKFEFDDYQMTRATLKKIIARMTDSQMERSKLKSALKTYESGVRRLRYCLVMDGVKIRNAKEWKAYNTPSGFTAGQVHYLKRLIENPSL